MPDLIRYDVKHSYIIELKYLSVKDSEAKAEAQWKEAVEQIKGYAAGPKVRRDDIRHRVALHRHAVSRMGVGTDGRSQIETLPDIIILNTQIFISHSVFPVNL